MSNTFDRLGYGTYKLADGEECVGGVAHAIETGYRHIDTAQGYDNEASVSVGIDRTDVGARTCSSRRSSRRATSRTTTRPQLRG